MIKAAYLTCWLLAGWPYLSNPAFSQRPFSHHIHEGYAYVASLRQDSSGFLWINSGDLGRYDGYNLVTYKDSLGNALRGSLFVDPSGSVWICRENLIYSYNKMSDSFILYRPDVGNAFISTVGFENDGRAWLGTWEDGIFLFDSKKKITKEFVNQNGDSAQRSRSNLILDIQEYPDHLLIGTSLGLWCFDKEKKAFSRPSPNVYKTPFLSEQPIRGIFPGRDHFWFSLPARLIKTDLDFNIVQQFEYSLEMGTPVDVDRDRAGTFWIATYGKGLVSFDPGTGKVVYLRKNPADPSSLASDLLQCVLVDRDQNIWVGTFENGFDQIKKQSLTFYNALLPGGANAGNPHIVEIGDDKFLLADSKANGLWTSPLSDDLDATRFQPLTLFGPSLTGFKTTNSLLGKEFWWVGTWGHGLIGVPINPKTGMLEKSPLKRFSHDPKNINTIDSESAGVWVEDDSGNLWMNSSRNVLYKINRSVTYGEAGSLIRYTNNPNDSTTIGPGAIWGVMQGEKNTMWVLTDSGLDLLNEGRFEHVYITEPSQTHYCLGKTSNGTLLLGGTDGLLLGTYENGKYQFSKVEALRGRVIYSIEEDRKGRLWLGGVNGMFCYDKQDQTTLQFKEEDGLLSNEFSANTSTQTSDGIMIFSSANSLTLFDPLSFRASSTKVRPVITGLRVNNKPVRIGRSEQANRTGIFSLPENIDVLSELVLDYKHNIFSLEFAAVQLTSPKKNLYQHKLEGFDPDWIQTDWKDRKATYTNLDPGSYLFKVKASNQDGVWSDSGRTLKVIILPPPWRTWWAYTLYFFTIAGSIWYYVKSRERSLRERQIELEHTVTERTADVLTEKREVEKQRNRSDELLLNILPSEVAEELKLRGSIDAKQFENVTVMFTDFKNFTQISEKLTPTELVAEIHSCFKTFDNIITKYNIEKIKTIGDSYMCVGGLPVANETHAADVVNAALEIQQFIKQNAEQGRKEGKEPFEIRIGIHTGPVVAGIVGIKKFAYDIWGDTVNLASRMESSGEAGKVNISQSTYERIKDDLNFKFEFRGKIEAKHKGVIEMYFVEGA